MNENNTLETEFLITNLSPSPIRIKKIIDESENTISTTQNMILQADETVKLNTIFNPQELEGNTISRILIVFENGYTKTIRISAEIEGE